MCIRDRSTFLPTIPAFLLEESGKKDQGGGAFRGTAYHRALELLNFPGMKTISDVEMALDTFRREKYMDEESLSLLDAGILWNFLSLSLIHIWCKRWNRAAEEGKQQPVYG